jgi:hypothetical protein
VFHVELRQFPHMTREFNLDREQLDARVLRPWVRGEAVELGERRWAPDRARLAIYEGRAVESDEIGMGRGWGNVTKTAEDVTARVLDEARRAAASPPALDRLKALLVARAQEQPLKMATVLGLAGELRSDSSANERVELANRAIWELLQEERLTLSAAR